MPPIDVGTQSNLAAPSTQWLKSGTSIASERLARQAVEQAAGDYRAGAWLSAEAAAWQALQHAARAVDQRAEETGFGAAADPQASALTNLTLAKQAMLEARDFTGAFGNVDPEAITRMARSHQTNLLDQSPTAGLTGADAADRYLDFARVQLAAIASHSATAAEAMDLMAVIYLRRNEAHILPSATALCLRRAALQGQPDNASLAANLGKHLSSVGLLDEAQWALEHALALEPTEDTVQALARLHRFRGDVQSAEALLASIPAPPTTQRPMAMPEITQLSPQAFAALSAPVVWESSTAPQLGEPPARSQTRVTPVSAAMTLPTAVVEPAEPISQQPAGTFNGIRRVWDRWLKSVSSLSTPDTVGHSSDPTSATLTSP